MWSGVADRNERLRNAHDNSPSGYIWHARRLFGADVDLDALTKQQWKQVADARLAWLKANQLKAVRARQLQRARRLRDRADAIEPHHRPAHRCADDHTDQEHGEEVVGLGSTQRPSARVPKIK
jgi:hypothetical protein